MAITEPEDIDVILKPDPLFADQTEDAIRERWVAWANEGVTPDQVDEWADTREGQHWHRMTMLGVREAAKWYDRAGTEVVLAGHPLWAFSDYLDSHAFVQDILRLVATYATGTVTVTAEEGTVIDPATRFGVEPVEEGELLEFESLAEATVPADPDPDTVGTVDIPVRATDTGSAYNVGDGAVTLILTALDDDAATVTNADPMTGGSDVETDAGIRQRLFGTYRGVRRGNVYDYVLMARAVPGVGRATVIPVWNGPGTVLVIVSGPNGEPVSAGVVADVQEALDPVAGLGAGQAPISANVTVQTAAVLAIDVTATVELETGYSLDGAGGTIDVSPTIEQMLDSYISKVRPGGEVVKSKIGSAIVSVVGVHDVNVTVPAANVAVNDDPAEAPALDTLTLTAGAVP